MTTKTERKNIDKLQAHLAGMKRIAKEEQAANIEVGDAAHANGWTEVHARVELLHAELTKLGAVEARLGHALGGAGRRLRDVG